MKHFCCRDVDLSVVLLEASVADIFLIIMYSMTMLKQRERGRSQ